MTTRDSVRERVTGTVGLGQHAGASRQSDTFVSPRLPTFTKDISTSSLHLPFVELASAPVNMLMET
jgi:hypothetical protein